MVRIAINGFGRIGRQFLRALLLRNEDIEVVAINDLVDPNNLAYLFKHDSVYKDNFDVKVEGNQLLINGKRINIYSEKDPHLLPWRDLNIDVVVEATGFFTKKQDALKHIDAGARKVLITAPSDDADFTIIKGVNEHLYKRDKHVVISNGSCTTNAVTPTLKVIDDNYGVEYAMITTVHAYTSTQGIIDKPSRHWERGRAAAVNIVPTSTGASRAVVKALPHLNGKISAIALRVPVVNGSIVEINALLSRETNKNHVNWLFSEVSKYHLKGILGYTDELLVSTDIIRNSLSGIISGQHTEVINGKLLRVLVWYDNEWGYSNRLIDIIKIL